MEGSWLGDCASFSPIKSPLSDLRHAGIHLLHDGLATIRFPLTMLTAACRSPVRKLDLHEDAVVRYCVSTVAIMGFECGERDRPVPVYADRCFGVDEPPPTAGH
jgi:hypothetical protein